MKNVEGKRISARIKKEEYINIKAIELCEFSFCDEYPVFKLEFNNKNKMSMLYFNGSRYYLNNTTFIKTIEHIMYYIKNWKEVYFDSSILDGIQWHLEIKFNYSNKVFSGGSNHFPKNYHKIKEYIQEFINDNQNEFKNKSNYVLEENDLLHWIDRISFIDPTCK